MFLTHEKKNMPGDSSRDLLIPQLEVTIRPLNGHVFTIPKRSQSQNCRVVEFRMWPKTWGTSQDLPRSKKTKVKLVRLSQCNSKVLSIFMVSCPKSVHGCLVYLHT